MFAVWKKSITQLVYFLNLQLPTEVVLFFFQRSLGGSWYFPQNNAPWTIKIGMPDLCILMYKKELLSSSS